MTKATPKFKSQAITHARRFSITNRALDVKFAAEEKKLAKLEGELALALCRHFYSPEKQAALQLLAGLHDIETYTSISLGRLDGWSYRELELPEGEAIQMLSPRFSQKMFDQCPPPSRLAARLEKLRIQRAKYEQKRREFRGVLQNLLHSTKTTKALVELLPEATEWLIDGCSDLPSADLAAQLHSM